ncbi:hypothetical protein E2L07_09245 [Halalkalibacterium halodurans]|uniref:hypothetical protein n=1 Tax=Halalkalibacterium halodurans TaxID=86665 RepID=UPI001067861F|nr:hypothetical protein [Halalkalibacterium halodurans]TES54802.1 hypothetical protein E2L07_09245 [Halalkalibacterium halodurans]
MKLKTSIYHKFNKIEFNYTLTNLFLFNATLVMAVLKRFKSLLLKQYHTISQLQVPNSHQMSPYDPPGEPLKGFIIEEKG